MITVHILVNTSFYIKNIGHIIRLSIVTATLAVWRRDLPLVRGLDWLLLLPLLSLTETWGSRRGSAGEGKVVPTSRVLRRVAWLTNSRSPGGREGEGGRG